MNPICCRRKITKKHAHYTIAENISLERFQQQRRQKSVAHTIKTKDIIKLTFHTTLERAIKFTGHQKSNFLKKQIFLIERFKF